MVLATDYPFLSAMWSIFVFFGLVIFFWLLITVYADLFRRHDCSGWAKFGWVLFTLVTPFLGVFVYLIAQGGRMADREYERQVRRQRGQEEYIRQMAGTSGVDSADEIAKARALLDQGAISEGEYEAVKRKVLA